MQLRPILWLVALTAVVNGTLPSPLLASEPVAVLVQMSGEVRVQRSGAGRPAPATLGLQLSVGDALVLSAGARAVLLYRTGRVESVTETLRLEAPLGQRSGVFAQAITTLTQIATSDRKPLNRQGMIRPIPGAAVPISPRNELTVLSRRPTFVWFRVPDAAGYVVQIRSGNGMPVRFEVGSDTSWVLPEPYLLSPGITYQWTVGEVGDGRVAPEQRFRTATAEERRRIRDRLREISAAGLDPEGDGLFLVALVYRDAGLLQEADRALDRIAARGAGTGPAFHALRGEVYLALGREEDARKAFEQAASAGSR